MAFLEQHWMSVPNKDGVTFEPWVSPAQILKDQGTCINSQHEMLFNLKYLMCANFKVVKVRSNKNHGKYETESYYTIQIGTVYSIHLGNLLHLERHMVGYSKIHSSSQQGIGSLRLMEC